ncbi:hypothetical protein KVH02_34825 [Streptomyces olivaceus]|uniref:Uncharacterized protein n=1 Tax=Streptomyces olivaceus TaxID=47716 RepID=A0ABS7WE87_STROV|nr:hypothetical protein [Streptomyces olivaceus]MBZ6093439.1 hypothetical protein [Streptomyces olivaceus]MBZ6100534.1 hypothetical protein [Streptomyces olivaceus]MBZ6121635.1 hypothetical protein [Streptomyces olivaceus]MBZ6156272.1 hypothetical protein [Streptomyces olivaceus]MBZ6302924.1 hypothetical protein [Streptomyces olivaceus]
MTALPFPQQRRARRAPFLTFSTPHQPLTAVTVTETTQVLVADPGWLIRHGRKLAKADPARAAQHGWTPRTPMTESLALTLLLAEADPAEVAEQAGAYGLLMTSVHTLATRTNDDSTIYESETTPGD